MRSRLMKAVAVGAPVITGATLLGIGPAYADGPTESLSVTATHKNGLGTNVTCTLNLSIITKYQNQAGAALARYEMTNLGDCRDATLHQTITWVTPQSGNARIDNYIGPIDLLPTRSSDVYRPVNASLSTAQFTEAATVTFDNCIDNCAMQLSLTADGVK